MTLPKPLKIQMNKFQMMPNFSTLIRLALEKREALLTLELLENLLKKGKTSLLISKQPNEYQKIVSQSK